GKLMIQFHYDRVQFLIHHFSKANQIGAVRRPKRCEVFVSSFEMRIASRVIRSQALCDLASSKVRIEIDKAIHDDCNPVTLPERVIDQPSDLSREVLPETLGELSQPIIRLFKVAGRAAPRPVDIVMSDRNENQIGKTLHSQ